MGNKGRTFVVLSSLFLIFLCVNACKKDEEKTNSGKIVFEFKHRVDGDVLEVDRLNYTDYAGYKYLINEIQYFISKVKLYKSDGTVNEINEWKSIHYVDTDIEDTQKWEVFDEIIPGLYDSISFVFGIDSASNESYMYANPPENNMFWPDNLGGGYHYLKCNGKYQDPPTLRLLPFNMHLGIGQIYATDTINVNQITGFIHNYFTVSLPGSSFEIKNEETKLFSIVMNIEQWFKDPHVYDHKEYGSYIMQTQEAMNIVKENGHNVFSFERN